MIGLLEDTRPVVSITLDKETICVGDPFVANEFYTKIVPYGECGEMGYVVWFAIFVGNDVVRRVNGKFVESVFY